MNTTKLAITNKAAPQKKEKSGTTEDAIRNRRSKELVIGLCGALGSGTKDLSSELKKALEDNNYTVYVIKISDLIAQHAKLPKNLVGSDRYRKLQDAGDDLRKQHGSSTLAKLVIKKIQVLRESHEETLATAEKESLRGKKDISIPANEAPPPITKTTERIAYIIDQLKHQDEIMLFRLVYRMNFYLLGLISIEIERKLNLKRQNIPEEEIEKLIRRDRKDDNKHGQQVEKSLQEADFFIRNTQNNFKKLKDSVERFIKVAHGYNGATPTQDEVGMYAAFSAALQSACLSRQVGSCIMSQTGDILSVGCNDVPASGGGLYPSIKNKTDFRCIHKGERCYNDLYKSRFRDDMEKVLQKEFKDLQENRFKKIDELALDEDKKKVIREIISEELNKVLKTEKTGSDKKLSDKLFEETPAKSLIEYSRAIHAEMDAILKLARAEGPSTIDQVMYCTTYPCHNCARHIVAAGISKVYYIEPYEKSLAIELHDDAISIAPEDGKVLFEPFEGVSPRRYEKFFFMSEKRKEPITGKAIVGNVKDMFHADPQFLDSYTDYESKVISDLPEALA